MPVSHGATCPRRLCVHAYNNIPHFHDYKFNHTLLFVNTCPSHTAPPVPAPCLHTSYNIPFLHEFVINHTGGVQCKRHAAVDETCRKRHARLTRCPRHVCMHTCNNIPHFHDYELNHTFTRVYVKRMPVPHHVSASLMSVPESCLSCLCLSHVTHACPTPCVGLTHVTRQGVLSLCHASCLYSCVTPLICCSALQCVAVCYSVLQCVAVYCTSCHV